jgi:hypothetical protein
MVLRRRNLKWTPRVMDLRPTEVSPRCQELPSARVVFLILAPLGLLSAAAVLFRFDPSQFGFYPLCWFHRTTGLWCPGCGSLRSLHQLLHGNLAVALRYNALLVFSLPLLAWLGCRMALARIGKKPSVPISVQPAWLWTAAGVLIAFGILRNLPAAHLAWLVP